MHRTETVLAVGMVEAGRRLGLSARTIATLIARKELPSRKVGRRRLIAVRDLEDFIRRGSQDRIVARAKPTAS
jgi:excisionase family DNA binding protein